MAAGSAAGLARGRGEQLGPGSALETAAAMEVAWGRSRGWALGPEKEWAMGAGLVFWSEQQSERALGTDLESVLEAGWEGWWGSAWAGALA